MSVIINSIGLRGMNGYIVKVEVKILNGLSSFTIVGLPDLSVKESKQRVMATLHSVENALFLEKKIIINLSPAEQKKNGPFFDLAIAIAIIIEMQLYPIEISSTTAFLGALSLNGAIQPIEGILPALLAPKNIGIRKIYCPYHPSLLGLKLDEVEIIYVSTFEETIQILLGKKSGQSALSSITDSTTRIHDEFTRLDFSTIIGHSFSKRAMEIAAAGGHNVLMSGPPGCGKSMLAEHFPSILPPLSSEQQLEVLSLYQLAAVSNPPITAPPFRQPHHSSSAVSLIGGGSNPKPGEISLAHNGVLFLDEMAEFTKKSLDMLRQPLERGKITISRALTTVTYPARFILLAALNPCPCGYSGSQNRFCLCSSKQVLAYRRKISGPITDRIDILLELKSVDFEKELGATRESSEVIRKRVIKARLKQYERYGKKTILNSFISNEILLQASPLSSKQERKMQLYSINHHLSTRAQMKIIRVARTISDLAGETTITDQAIEEAILLRQSTLPL